MRGEGLSVDKECHIVWLTACRMSETLGTTMSLIKVRKTAASAENFTRASALDCKDELIWQRPSVAL
jgi:hypothetical protein